MKTISLILALFILALVSVNTFAQTPTPTATPIEDEGEAVKISTTLIQLDVTVTGKDGKIVTDLKPGDLEVYENGKRQEVTNFSFISRKTTAGTTVSEKPQPTIGKLTIAAPSSKIRPDQVQRAYTLVVDDSRLTFGSNFRVKQALKKFINEDMQTGDLVAIIRTGRTNGTLSSFTFDKRQLLAVVDKMKWTFVSGGTGISTFEPISEEKGLQGLAGTGSSAGSNPYDPSLENATDQSRSDNFAVGTLGVISQTITGMRNLPGRKAIILFSEGFALFQKEANATVASQTKATESIKAVTDLANRASVVIYTIDPRGLENVQMFQAQDNVRESGTQAENRGIKVLETQQSLRIMAEETGGLALINQNDINKSLRRAVEDQSSYYLLGYVPDEETFDPNKNKFNKLEIKSVRPGLTLRYRSGFFGVADEKYLAQQKAKEQNVAAALSSPFGASDISLDLTSVYANDVKDGNIVRALLNIDAKDLSFTDLPDGGKQTEFTLHAFAFGENGKILNSLSRTYQVKVSKDDYQKMIEKGFVYFMNVPFKKPGAYQLRVALQDTKTKKIGASSQFIEVPDLNKNNLTLSGLLLQTYTNEEWNAQNVSTKDSGKAPTAIATAIRKFRQGNVLQFSYAVYNAKNQAGTNFKSQTRLYRDGQLVFEGKQMPLNLAGNDGKRSEAEGAVGLGREIIPGDYVLQVIVFDETARDKKQVASQSIDFEVTN